MKEIKARIDLCCNGDFHTVGLHAPKRGEPGEEYSVLMMWSKNWNVMLVLDGLKYEEVKERILCALDEAFNIRGVK